MKTRILAPMALAPLALLSLASVARAEAPTLSMGSGVMAASPRECLHSVHLEIKDGGSLSKKYTVGGVSHSLDYGEYTLGEIRDACAKAAGPECVKDMPDAADGVMRQINRMSEVDSTYDIDQSLGYARDIAECLVDAAVDPSTPIKGELYQGTVGALGKDVLDKANAAIADFYAVHLAEHKKLLKNDKWTMLVKGYPDGFVVPGGDGYRTADPKALAKAKLWFDVSSREPGDNDRCNDKIYTYYRHQFDKNGKLVKDTQKDYCGDPGGKGLR